MARKKYVVFQEGSPVLFEFGEWDSKIDNSGPCVLSDYEPESNFRGVVGASLVGFIFVFHRDFGIVTEDVWNSL